jgi:hypothetical protein
MGYAAKADKPPRRCSVRVPAPFLIQSYWPFRECETLPRCTNLRHVYGIEH